MFYRTIKGGRMIEDAYVEMMAEDEGSVII